jgi:hypothetical protein
VTQQLIASGEPARQQGALRAPSGRRDLRSVLAIDEREPIIEFAQTAIGKLVLVSLFAALLVYVKSSVSFQVVGAVAAAAACAYLPKYRALTLFTSTSVALVVRTSFWFPLDGISTVMLQEQIERPSARTLTYAALIAFFVCSWCALELARRYKTLYMARRPVVTLLALEVLLWGLGRSPLVHGLSRVVLWSFLTVFTAYIWFLAYALVDQRSRDRSPNLFQLGIFHPFWGSSSTPWGKGAAFLRKTESKTPRALAISQIKALKLLAWSLVLLQLTNILVWLFEGELHIPNTELAQAAFLQHQPYSTLVGWVSLIWSTAKGALSFSIWGSQTVAVARLAGFRLPRNTWRPLESRTLIEFWNRYYYYFKELLVEFFFMPTFLRMFRNHPRLRLFFSTFMAAGVGNAVFHFLRDISVVATMGLWNAIETYTSYMFYSVVLATGIGISQLRTGAGWKPSPTFLGRVRSFLCVWTFVVCLNVFGDETRVYTLGQRLSFMASLIGVN